MHLDDKATVNPRYEELHGLAQDVLRGTARPMNTAQELFPCRSVEEPFTDHSVRVAAIPDQADGTQRQGAHPAGDEG